MRQKRHKRKFTARRGTTCWHLTSAEYFVSSSLYSKETRVETLPLVLYWHFLLSFTERLYSLSKYLKYGKSHVLTRPSNFWSAKWRLFLSNSKLFFFCRIKTNSTLSFGEFSFRKESGYFSLKNEFHNLSKGYFWGHFVFLSQHFKMIIFSPRE